VSVSILSVSHVKLLIEDSRLEFFVCRVSKLHVIDCIDDSRLDDLDIRLSIFQVAVFINHSSEVALHKSHIILHDNSNIGGSMYAHLNPFNSDSKSHVFINPVRSPVCTNHFTFIHSEKSILQYNSDHIRPHDVLQSIIIHVVHLADQSFVSIISFIY